MDVKIVKAEHKIDAACTKLKITNGGKLWLDNAIDPFKDLPRPHEGYPDRNMNPSVIEVVKKTTTVIAPTSLDSWSCNIFLDSILDSMQIYETTETQPRIFVRDGQVVGTPVKRGGLQVRKGLVGQALENDTTDNANCLSYFPQAEEEIRLVSHAFEVHNETPELFKSGTVVCYRVPAGEDHIDVANVIEDAGITACIPSSYQFIPLCDPPELITDANDLPGSKQWEAKKGCYVVPILTSDSNEAIKPSPAVAFATDVSGSKFIPQISTTGAAKLISITSTCTPTPWSCSGAFFSGLTPQTVLVINYTAVIERFPDALSAIRRLTRPSVVEDFAAIELYSKVAQQMPVGVEVRANGIGDWISGLADIVSWVANSSIGADKRRNDSRNESMTGRITHRSDSMAIVPYVPEQQKQTTTTVSNVLSTVGGYIDEAKKVYNGGKKIVETVTQTFTPQKTAPKTMLVSNNPLVERNFVRQGHTPIVYESKTPRRYNNQASRLINNQLRTNGTWVEPRRKRR